MCARVNQTDRQTDGGVKLPACHLVSRLSFSAFSSVQMLRRFPSVFRRACHTLPSPCRTRYCPTSHTWVSVAHDGNRCRIGMTNRGLQDIGDATHVSSATVGAAGKPSEPLLRIEWEAMKISDGDELYHTTWANISGCKSVPWPPVSATVVAINVDLIHSVEGGSAPMETQWLVELALDDVDAVLGSSSPYLDAVAYQKAVALQGVGPFADEDDCDRLAYSSYG